jgi:hypothetical protein
MLKYILALVGLFNVNANSTSKQVAIVPGYLLSVSNNCKTFSVGPGTGCAWMCNYCATQLGTNNYYFTDSVCKYQSSGCVGNPVAGVSYTCCSLSRVKN